MGNLSVLLHILLILAAVSVGLALALGPIFLVARYILVPIDRAAKSRKAPVRFSIGDFLCLFLAIQIPLAVVHRFMSPDTMDAYWGFTLITWLIAPVIWYMGAHTLSKAQITKTSHRFIFLGLILPLVYYGVIPFTALGLSVLVAFSPEARLPFQSLAVAWVVLAVLYFICGRYVRWMVRQAPTGERTASDEQDEHQLFRPDVLDTPADGDLQETPYGVPAKTA